MTGAPAREGAENNPDPDQFFAMFWTAYPRHVDKGGAARAWKAAVKLASPAEVVEGAQRYAAETRGREARFIAHPSTWLRGERWTDEPLPDKRQPRGPRWNPSAEEEAAARSAPGGQVLGL